MIYNQSLIILPEQMLEYRVFENGDRIPDYSFCGYDASNTSIPYVAAKVTVGCSDGDATARIQRAIDYVASLPTGIDGFRGAVQLQKGVYRIDGSLKITVSGVVLRGSGYGEDGTILLGTGVDRATLIRIAGYNDRKLEDSIPITGKYVPLNATFIPLQEGHGLKAGDWIVITRPSTDKWLEYIGTNKIGTSVNFPLTHWTAGDFDLRWERTVTTASPTSATIDVPLTNSLDVEYGMGYINRYRWDRRINKIGVENLRCVSEYDTTNLKDENHRWMAITVENAEDGWVRRVTGEHFVSSIVAIWETTRRFTVEDCKCLNPVGEIGGYRRYAFQTLGQQTLFQRCYAEYGYHDFSVGFTAAGPNAFVQCYSYHPHEFSGTLGGWSCGTLFDRVTVDGAPLKITFRDVDGQGGGWSGVNSLCWECRAPQLHLMTPPGAYNWAFGSWGQSYGNGSYEMPQQLLRPASFYYAQLEARTGKKSAETSNIFSFSYQTIDQTDPPYTVFYPAPVHVAKMSKRSENPELTMDKWIDTITTRFPLMSAGTEVFEMDSVKWTDKNEKSKKSAALQPINIDAGRIVVNGKPLTGRILRTSMWTGNTRPEGIRTAGVHLSRFVPGRTGVGLTDDLDTVAAILKRRNVVALNHYPALWYERRRDDHGRSRRANADVWAPFYEQPFGRSGQGEAFDRLSKYDLNRFNCWYWMRLKQFANIADKQGILFIQDHYLQHNIIESGSHWADFPWRTANNINDLGFPENVYYAEDRRVFMADQFYDITDEKLIKYHRLNIRKHLDDLGGNMNVAHHLGAEFTGPTHFVEFWLSVIEDWEKEHGCTVKVMLSATKDVTDAILEDTRYRPLVDIIEIQQWHYRTDGSLYAPEGGMSLAPRQYAQIIDPDTDDYDGIFRAVSEYRHKYSEKAVVYNYMQTPEKAWIIFLAGGSLCDLPAVADERFYRDAAQMLPTLTEKGKYWGMGKPSVGYIVYTAAEQLTLDLVTDKITYTVRWMNPNGEFVGKSVKISGGKTVTLEKPISSDAVVWLSKK